MQHDCNKSILPQILQAILRCRQVSNRLGGSDAQVDPRIVLAVIWYDSNQDRVVMRQGPCISVPKTGILCRVLEWRSLRRSLALCKTELNGRKLDHRKLSAVAIDLSTKVYGQHADKASVCLTRPASDPQRCRCMALYTCLRCSLSTKQNSIVQTCRICFRHLCSSSLRCVWTG